MLFSNARTLTQSRRYMRRWGSLAQSKEKEHQKVYRNHSLKKQRYINYLEKKFIIILIKMLSEFKKMIHKQNENINNEKNVNKKIWSWRK